MGANGTAEGGGAWGRRGGYRGRKVETGTKADPSQANWPTSPPPPPCGRQLGRAERQLLDPKRVPTERA